MNNYLKHYVLIEIKTKDQLSALKILHQINVNIYDIEYHKQSIVIKVENNELSKIKKYYKYKIKKHYNIYNYKNILKEYYLHILCIIIFFITIFLISNIIVDVQVIHTKQEVRNLVMKELKSHNIRKYTLKKDYNKITAIKQKILDDHPEELEWIEIETKGMKYIVKIEERIINRDKAEPQKCNIVANKDGVITRIVASKGEIITEENQYVKKGDILISNEIKFNEEVKNQVCAEGKVYAHTWYEINLKINKTYTKYEKTGKKRYNLKLKTPQNEYIIFKDRLNDFKREDKKILSVANTNLYLINDYEVIKKTKEFSKEEINDIINKEVEDKLKKKLNNDYTIISKNILKKSENNSIMDIDIFVVVEEDISNKEQVE